MWDYTHFFHSRAAASLTLLWIILVLVVQTFAFLHWKIFYWYLFCTWKRKRYYQKTRKQEGYLYISGYVELTEDLLN